jgi:hypothetical protein
MTAGVVIARAKAKHLVTPRIAITTRGQNDHTGLRETCRGQYGRETALLAAFFGQYDILANFVPGLAPLAILANFHTGHARVL